MASGSKLELRMRGGEKTRLLALDITLLTLSTHHLSFVWRSCVADVGKVKAKTEIG
jgi:hypothetical protein